MAEKKEFIAGKTPITFLDLFAGAGGISEGFMQAYTKDKYYDFILASDINENCELTHRVRYNYQLGLDTEFLTMDIMSPDFITTLNEKLHGKTIDVVTGGPSCQSFSLSGRRKRFDKRDNLFLHYLEVIKALRPKYFVMENVKGLLTKDKGQFKYAIMNEIRSIIDSSHIPQFYHFIEKEIKFAKSSFLKNCVLAKLMMEVADETTALEKRSAYIELLEGQLKTITRKIEYKLSKSNPNIATIRHGLKLLGCTDNRADITQSIINVKTIADIDNDFFADAFNSFLSLIDDSSIINTILSAIDSFDGFNNNSSDIEEFREMIKLYSYTLEETSTFIKKYAEEEGKLSEFEQQLNDIRLYNVANL